MRLLVFSSNGAYTSDPAKEPSAGGAERSLRWTAEAAAAAGHDVTYVTVDPATPALNLAPRVRRIDVAGVSVHLVQPLAIPRLGRQLLARREALLLRELSAVMADADPDVVFTYAPAPDTWLAIKARERTGSRARIVERVSGRPWESALVAGGADAERVRVAFARRDATLYCSRSVREYALGKLGEYGIVPSGAARIADLSPTPAATSAKLRSEVSRLFASHAHALSFVGRFKPQSKRQDVALEALALLAGRGIDACIAFAGDGRLLEAARRQAEQLGVLDRCAFPGYLDAEEIAALVEASSVGLLLTDFEGNAKSAIDYVRRGIPCVMSDIPPNAELLEDEPRLGTLLLTRTSPEDAADRLEGLLGDPVRYEEAQALTTTLAARLAERFSPSAFVETLLSVGTDQ